MADTVTRLRRKLTTWRATVTAADWLSPNLRMITAVADGGEPLEPGDTIALRVLPGGFGPTGTWRRYTVAGVEASAFKLLVATDANGPGTALVRDLGSGASLTCRGPERAVRGPTAALTIVTGDDTGLGVLVATSSKCAVRPAMTVRHPELLASPPFVTNACAQNCPDLRRVLGSAIDEVGRDAVALVAVGQRAQVNEARQAATRLGLDRRQMLVRSFWDPRRTGLE
jgi:hypothetical protein